VSIAIQRPLFLFVNTIFQKLLFGNSQRTNGPDFIQQKNRWQFVESIASRRNERDVVFFVSCFFRRVFKKCMNCCSCNASPVNAGGMMAGTPKALHRFFIGRRVKEPIDDAERVFFRELHP